MKKLISFILVLMLAIGCAAFASEEDGQDPVINIIGDYADQTSQRAYMQIGTAGNNIADVTIYWSNSATEMVVWHFTGECNDDDCSVSYTDCVKSVVTTDDENASEEIVYENGTGKLLCNDETGNITWQDDVEDAGKDCVFVFDMADQTFTVAGVQIGASEASVRETLGEPAAEETLVDMKVLVYDNVNVANVNMKARFMFSDDMLRVMRFTTDSGNSDVANDLSVWMDAESNETDAGLEDAAVENYATTYCGMTNFDNMTFFSRYANDGTLLIYIRTSETDIDVLCLDHYTQN